MSDERSDDQLTDAEFVAKHTAISREGFVPPPPSTNGHHAPNLEAPIIYDDKCRLGDDFWNVVTPGPLGDRLRHIRTAAYARQVGPTAVLDVTLARLGAGVDHTVCLDPVGGAESPLGLFVGMLGAPGTGKGVTLSTSRALLPASRLGLLVPGINDEMPPGSGEGFIDVLFDIVKEPDPNGGTKMVDRKRQVRHNAFFQLGEGETLGALRENKSSILMATLRSVFTGETVGQTNATEANKRILPSGAYTISFVVGFQPTKAGALLDDVDGGTPQRFLWAPVVDPNILREPPSWPGPLDWSPIPMSVMERYITDGPDGWRRHYLTRDPTITAEIIDHRFKVSTGEITLDPLDAHALIMRQRIAALLAILDDALHIGLVHWSLSAMVMAASDATRAVTLAANVQAVTKVAVAKREAVAKTTAYVNASEVTRQIVDGSRQIAAMVHVAGPDGVARKDLYRRARRWRDAFAEALDAALQADWITERSEPGRGENKRLFVPGGKKP